MQKLWPIHQLWSSACFSKYSFIGTQPHLYIYILAMPASEPKMCRIWPLRENLLTFDTHSQCVQNGNLCSFQKKRKWMCSRGSWYPTQLRWNPFSDSVARPQVLCCFCELIKLQLSLLLCVCYFFSLLPTAPLTPLLISPDSLSSIGHIHKVLLLETPA